MTEFARPCQLRYLPLAYRFPGQGPLRLDESYRLCHLPLIDPTHPDVIARKGRVRHGMVPNPELRAHRPGRR